MREQYQYVDTEINNACNIVTEDAVSQLIRNHLLSVCNVMVEADVVKMTQKFPFYHTF